MIEQLNEITLAKLRTAVFCPAKYIKFWENITIDKVLLFHYNEKINVIRNDIASMGIPLDLLTPPPESDMSIADVRSAWPPDKFFWMHPPLGWFREDYQTLTKTN